MGGVRFGDDQLAGFVQDEYRFRPNLSFSFGLRYNWQNHLHDNTQFAPRFAFAYSPDKKRRTVIRAGAGVFFDRTGPNPPGDLLLYNGVVLRNVLILNPTYPDPFSGRASWQIFPPTSCNSIQRSASPTRFSTAWAWSGNWRNGRPWR